MDIDLFFMRIAFQEALYAFEEKEVPIGVLIVKDHKIIGKAHNQVETLQDPTAHAEILAITQASTSLQSWRLLNTTLYTTLEPCFMCTGALHLARVQRIVYGASDSRKGALVSQTQFFSLPNLNYYPDSIEQGPLKEDCEALIRQFFTDRRKNKPSPLKNDM